MGKASRKKSSAEQAGTSRGASTSRGSGQDGTFRLTATHRGNGESTAAETVAPAAAESGQNQPPQLIPVSPKTTHPTQPLSFLITAFDPDGDPLTFELVAGPAGAQLDDATGEFTWTAQWTELGTWYATVRVRDPQGDSDQLTFAISVVNAAPQMAPLPNQTGHPTQPMEFLATAFDPDGDPLTFSLVQAPAGATLDPTTGQFSWTPTWSDLGAFLITIRVTDPGGASAQQSCVLQVANQPPQLQPLMDLTVQVEVPVEFVAVAFDPDGDPVSYAKVLGPATATLDAQSGSFSWTPTTADVGAHVVTIRATDPGGQLSDQSCVISVVS